jgi:hypothetical protein
MTGVGELPMRQGKAFLPDPLRDAALMLLEHPVQVAQRHCHVVCDGLCVEFALREVIGDETLSPQEAQGHDVVAPWCVMTPWSHEQPQPGADLLIQGRGEGGQRIVYETEDPIPQRPNEQLPRTKAAIDLEQRGL